MKYINLLVIVLFSLFISCTGTDNKSEKKEQVTVNAQELLDRMKYHPNDPFKDKIVESEFFEVSGLKDEVIEGKDGTVIVVPKGAFLDKDGNVVEKKINSIAKDLRYQAKFFEEQKRQDKKKVRLKFELELAKKAFPSCYFSGEDIAFSE